MRNVKRTHASSIDIVTPKTSTRDAIVRLLLEGPLSAATIADKLQLTTAAVRRHLDIMLEEGTATAVDPSPYTERGRGRPAKLFHLSDRGRASFGHAYDDLAVDALRLVRKVSGEATLLEFSLNHMRSIVKDVEQLSQDPTREDIQRGAQEIAQAFNNNGFATSVENAAGGIQVCHHHCPIAHVSHEFPCLCTAEHQAISEILQLPIQRLSTIAHGSHTCTTNISTGPSSVLAINVEKEDV